MLKYKLNINKMSTGMKLIDVTDIFVIRDYDSPDTTIHIKCLLGSNVDIEIGDDVVVRYSDTFLTSKGDKYEETTYKEFSVISVDDEELSFIINGNARDRLVGQSAVVRTEWVEDINSEIEENEETIADARNVDYVYLYLLEPHHFANDMQYENPGIIFINNIATECEYVDDFTLKFKKDNNINAYNSIFYLEENKILKYKDLSDILIEREQFFFNAENLDKVLFSINRQVFSVRLPLYSTYTPDTYKELDINTKFVKAETEKTITGFNDLEKDAYYPAIDNGSVIELVNKIRINMHFRKHRGNKWIVETGATWNGVYQRNDNFAMMNASNNESNGFFSYSLNERSNQSDLLSYLGFTDSDLKFRRNKLTKSFIRILFYDSTDIRKQNLLAYSTVFFDVAGLYSKYIRNISNPNITYSKINVQYDENQDSANNTTLNLRGIRVDREPYWDLSSDRPIDMDIIEQYRLSSQIVIKDKYNSTKSSEGFYLYLWKDNYMGDVAQDIYARIEFNHAGFGRIIPFMLPYKENTSSTSKMKTFQEIMSDWEPYDTTGAEVDETKAYTIEDYQKYSYIHFKYKFDRDLNKHVYYLDTETYGDDAKFEDGAITLNLYEANVL